ncbi:MAG: outer membrane beta-barrel protein [Chitinophagales bacterium]
MKKTIILLTITLLSLVGFQKSYAGGLGGLGLKGGMNFSTIGLENENFQDARNRFRIGGTAGLSYEIATDGTFAFEIEALYSLRGQRQKFESLGNEVTVKDYIHYAYFPASFKFYIGDVFNVHFGGYAGVAIAGKRKIEGSGFFDGEGNLFGDDIKNLDPQGDDYINRLDGGIHFGAEFISAKGIGVGSRGSIGLADITNDEHILGNGTARTGEISIYMIFRFAN